MWFALIVTLQFVAVNAQISASVEKTLKSMAALEIRQQLVNGSIEAKKSLRTVVQAGQILSYLGEDSSQAPEVCEWLESLDVSITTSSPEAVFYKAEATRLFKCQEQSKVRESVKKDVVELLASPTKYLVDVADYFNAFMINKRAKHYGAESSPSFLTTLSEKLAKEYGNFDAASFSFPGSTGVTMDGLYLLEMMSSFTKDTENSVNQKLREVVT